MQTKRTGAPFAPCRCLGGDAGTKVARRHRRRVFSLRAKCAWGGGGIKPASPWRARNTRLTIKPNTVRMRLGSSKSMGVVTIVFYVNGFGRLRAVIAVDPVRNGLTIVIVLGAPRHVDNDRPVYARMSAGRVRS